MRNKIWPETVPVLTARNIHRGDYRGSGGRLCLVGWCRESFKFGVAARQIKDAISAEIIARGGKIRKRSRLYDAKDFAEFNDSTDVPRQVIADVWNGAMARLGYTEVVEVPA